MANKRGVDGLTEEINKLAKLITEDPDVTLPEQSQPGDIGVRFVEFVSMLLSTVPHDKQDVAIQKALSKDRQSILAAMQQVEPTGNTSAIADYIKAKPSRVKKIVDLAAIILGDEDAAWSIVDNINFNTTDSTEEAAEDGDFYYDQGGDSDGH